VAALAVGGDEVNAVVAEIAMDGWRARALRWNLAHAPDRAAALFSTTELLYLGGGAGLDLHAWGMSALGASGCLCTQVPRPGLHAAMIGRPQTGLLPASIPDLNLRIAMVLSDLQLPAALARDVVEAALGDLVHDVMPIYHDDWLAFVRRARAVSREQIEDYLAVVTASAGPLVAAPTARRLP
jgi:hypothetical protein